MGALTPSGRGTRFREPAYLHIANTVADRIAGGIYRAGDQLPTETQLREEFGVSPMTVRRAVNILLDRGLVTTTQGKGTFVRALDLDGAVFRLQELTDRWASGGSVEVRLLEASIRPVDERVAQVLGGDADDVVVFLRRLLLRDGEPLAYQTEYVAYDPTRPLIEAQLQITSLDGLLQSTGDEGLLSGELSIEAVSLDEEASTLLEVPIGSPAFRLEHVFEETVGKPVSWGWFLCRADQFRLSTRIGAIPRAVGEAGVDR
jgi:DNA-binding GntR family transcriptional regulator